MRMRSEKPASMRALVLSLFVAGLLTALFLPGTPSSASHLRPKGATPIYDSFVIGYQPCASANRQHGGPLPYPSCNPHVPSSSYLTAGGFATGSTSGSKGYQKLQVCGAAGLANCPPNDIGITFNDEDVRCQPSGPPASCTSANSSGPPDYDGYLRPQFTVQITDHYNSGTSPGTVATFPIRYSVKCDVTPNTTGGKCPGGTNPLYTSVNAIVPLLANNEYTKRANIEVFGVQVFDGGADGDQPSPTDGDNTLYQESGFFIP
jgi:hypothetical protein